MFSCQQADAIPQKFHKHSGILDHDFRVKSLLRKTETEYDLGWPIEIFTDKWIKTTLPYKDYPHQIEALAILTRQDGETERQGRYINIHIAYESVEKERDVELSSIRHPLAQPITKITRPNVQESLTTRFGSLEINLHNYTHQKEIYRCIGQMLIATEDSIYNYIIKNHKGI
jgi:hypothetical protein